MKIFSLIKSAFTAMIANKLRTALTVLGMVIGISSVIVVFSAGEGINGLVLGQIQSFGTDIIISEIRIPSNKKGGSKEMESGISMVQGVQITTLKLEDMEDVNQLPNVQDSYAGMMSQNKISYGNESKKAFILGTNEAYINIDKTEIKSGRFFTEAEDKSLTQVAILGSEIKEDLFGNRDPIGKFIKIKKTKFRVIGVAKERGAVVGMNFDDYV